ncbi:MAG TPA: hypothetical protein VF152_03940 [Acidimicrobiia bacterium]
MLALQTWMTVAIVLAAISALTLLLIIIGPTRSVREEPPLDEGVESRILLGEDAEQIEEELEEEEQEEGEGAPSDRPGLPGPAA